MFLIDKALGFGVQVVEKAKSLDLQDVAMVGLAIGSMAVVEPAAAAVLVDTAQLTTMETDIGDTVAEIGTWLVGIIFTIGGVMFGVNMTKKGLGKAGAR